MRLFLVVLLPLAISTSPANDDLIEQIKSSAIAHPPLRFMVEIKQLETEKSSSPEGTESPDGEQTEPSWQQSEGETETINETTTNESASRSTEKPRIHKAKAVAASTSTPYPTLLPPSAPSSAPLEVSPTPSSTLPTQPSFSSPPTSSPYDQPTSSSIVIPPIFHAPSMPSQPAASPSITSSSQQPTSAHPTLRPSKIFSLIKDAVASPPFPSHSFNTSVCPCACPRYSVATNTVADERIAMKKGDYFYLMVNSLSPPRQRRQCCSCAGDKAGPRAIRKYPHVNRKPAASAASAAVYATAARAAITNGPFARRKVDALREVARLRVERSSAEHDHNGASLVMLSVLLVTTAE